MRKRKEGKRLAENRLDLEERLQSYQKQLDDLNEHYMEQLRMYERALEKGDHENAGTLMKCAESTAKMIESATAQYREAYDRIEQNGCITKDDASKHSIRIGTAVGVGTAIGSLGLGALSLYQAVETDRLGLLQRKNVQRFFEGINPIKILRDRH